VRPISAQEVEFTPEMRAEIIAVDFNHFCFVAFAKKLTEVF
jgi:hypothetical protein